MNKHIIHNYKKNKEVPIQTDGKMVNLATQKVIDNKSDENNISCISKIKYFFSKRFAQISIIGSILILISIIIGVVIPLKRAKKDEENITKSIFSPAFKINSKKDTLTQLSFKSSQSYETMINGEKIPYIIFSKAIYEIYILNSSSPLEEDKIYYKNKYTSAIVVNSFCNKLSIKNEENDCELETILDLNKRENNNLRRNEENEDLIEKAILPICIVEHTDTNIIISLTCPETYTQSFKNDIFQAFQNIKPNSLKETMPENSYIDINNIKGDNKINIDIFNNECSDLNLNDTLLMKCNSAKNIITDKEGNLLSSFKKITKNIIHDENNKFNQNLTYDFQIIPEKNSQSYNPKIFKTNLNIFLSKTTSLMKKEIYIKNFTSYFMDIKMKKEDNNTRSLEEYNNILSDNKGVQEENIFNKTIFDIPIKLDIKNDIGLESKESAKVYSIYNINNDDINHLSFKQFQSDLNNIFKEFISLSKSSNKLAHQLNIDLNEPLMKLMKIINEKIEQINNFLPNKDLSEIFDSTHAIKEIESISYDFIPTIENLSYSMDELENNIEEIMNDTMIKLNDDIYLFLSDSHNLINQLFNNLTELTNALSSEENKIVEISSYYLKEKDSAYYELVQTVKNIFDNYYKNEADVILPLINNMFQNFYEKTTDYIKRINYKLDNISERLNKDDLIIVDSKYEDKNRTLKYIEHLKNKMDTIIIIIKNKFNEIINLKENGYFETQEELTKKNQTFDSITTKAFNISQILDNNEYIDSTFDQVMSNFKEKFLSSLKYIENSLKEKFPLEENILGASFFDNIYLQKIDESFKNEKINILLFIKHENDNYLKSMENIFNFFMNNNASSFDQKMSDILNDLSELYLDNLNNDYNDTLSLVFESINEIIENNKNLANQYLTNVKNAGSYHITQGFINKYNIYINNHQTIYNFINNNLKSNLEDIYNNIMNQINSILQSLKTTNDNIFQKYNKQLLPYSENHISSIQLLFDRFNKHINNEVFNTTFLTQINNYISSINNNLQNIKTNYESIYNEVVKKSSSSSTNDYDKQQSYQGDRYCCKRVLGVCTRHCRDTIYYFQGYDITGTNNHLNLKSIQFSDYIENFDDKFIELYTKLSNDISSYNIYLPNLVNIIDSKKSEILIEDGSNYMNNIQQNLKDIIGEKLGNNLLQESYNYYEKEINDVLPITLNNILEQWKILYDEIYQNITSNKDYFKSSINEFYITALTYIEIYVKNISYDYIDSVIDKLKNDFNYTNKYYHDLINSKVNKVCSYVINNLPINEGPLDEILNIRFNEINNTCINMINEIQNSKNKNINKINQENVLNITLNNFFEIDDIINEHINNFNLELNEKLNNIKLIIDEINVKKEKNNTNELIVAKFYLENNINKKQIEDIYDAINKVSFIDLQSDAYHNMINDIWKNEKDELTKSIKNTINKINDINLNNFNNELTKYQKLLQDKLYNEFYTKKNLEEKLNSLFSNGLNNINENSKNQIFDILDEILNKTKYHLSNEAQRLTNEMTSYSNNYSYIENRLDDYKKIIYEKFYSKLLSKINVFHSKIIEKFFMNHIEKGCNEFKSYFTEAELGTSQFLNMSINLDEIMFKEINLLTNEYKNITLAQIEFLYQKIVHNLDEIFSFSNIQSKINNEINSFYNSELLPVLKREAIYNYIDEGISFYDFSSLIIKDIDSFIEEKMNKTEEIMKIMEGNQYEINEIFLANFSDVKENIIDNIKNQFINFTLNQKKKEREELNNTFDNAIPDNFECVLNDFIPSFSVDFFDRILKFNEIQKINVLYNDLSYSLYQTMISYLNLSESNNTLNLPLNIKNEILTLNNIETIIQSKNKEILSKLDSKLTNNFDEEKSFIVQTYITDIISDPIFESQFNPNIISIIKQYLNDNINKIENKYITKMETNIKDSFIKEYTNYLNKTTEHINYIIQDYKEQLKLKLNSLFSFDSDLYLLDIQNKVNDTKEIIEEYKLHFNTFKISENVKEFFNDKLSNEIIKSQYDELNDFLNAKSVKYVMNNLDFYSNEYKIDYSIEKFEELINTTSNNFSSYIDKYTNILNNYGSTKEIYEVNLLNEKNKYESQINNDNKELYDKNIDISFIELKNTSFIFEQFIQNLSLFIQFEEKIKNNIKDKNIQYEYTKDFLNSSNDNNTNYELMIERLEELNNISLEYYSQSNYLYLSMKEQIINDIIEINDLINTCVNITYEIIKNNYMEIKNKYKSIHIDETITNDNINIPAYIYGDNDTNNIFGIGTEIKNYEVNNEFNLNIIFDNNTNIPKVIGNLVNNIKPKTFNIDFYSSNGPTGKIGRKINVAFNNILSKTYIEFNGKLNNVTIITNFNFDEYSVKTQYYKEKTTVFEFVILGIKFVIPETKTVVNVETPNNEKYYEIQSKNKTIIEKYYY